MSRCYQVLASGFLIRQCMSKSSNTAQTDCLFRLIERGRSGYVVDIHCEQEKKSSYAIHV